jgi:hypothetical protein
MGQSTLRDWRTPFRIESFLLHTRTSAKYRTNVYDAKDSNRPKGNPVNIPEPGRGDARSFAIGKGGDANELEDADESSEESFLFFLRDGLRGTGSSGDTEVVPAKRRGSCGVRSALAGP